MLIIRRIVKCDDADLRRKNKMSYFAYGYRSYIIGQMKNIIRMFTTYYQGKLQEYNE